MSLKIYAPTTKADGIGGGFTFYRNFKKGMADKVHFVSTLGEADILFITGVTIIEKSEVYRAREIGKKIVLRVDNVPRRSRNKRSSPHERLKEFASMADVVVYQSAWAQDYCKPLCGDGTVIYNGVDREIFKPKPEIQNLNNYCFIYHGKNEQKNFWEAHLRFQYIFRSNPNAVFNFVYDFGRDDAELSSSGFDFWQGENVVRYERFGTNEEVAEFLQRMGGGIIYPSISDASPNIILEARACDCPILYPASKELAGTQELIELEDISLERMCDEYEGVFKVLMQENNQIL